VALDLETEIFCETTESTKTSWTISKLEDHLRDIPSYVSLADITRTEFHTINDVSQITLPGKFLPYGFYVIRARVEMRELPDVFGSDSIFVNVVQTPWLEAAVNNGSFHTVRFGLVVRTIPPTPPTPAWYLRRVWVLFHQLC
jgi:hypothetical protein